MAVNAKHVSRETWLTAFAHQISSGQQRCLGAWPKTTPWRRFCTDWHSGLSPNSDHPKQHCLYQYPTKGTAGAHRPIPVWQSPTSPKPPPTPRPSSPRPSTPVWRKAALQRASSCSQCTSSRIPSGMGGAWTKIQWQRGATTRRRRIWATRMRWMRSRGVTKKVSGVRRIGYVPFNHNRNVHALWEIPAHGVAPYSDSTIRTLDDRSLWPITPRAPRQCVDSATTAINDPLKRNSTYPISKPAHHLSRWAATPTPLRNWGWLSLFANSTPQRNTTA